jgi:gamma-glutamyltranspeptidase/glutathione hydrolase
MLGLAHREAGRLPWARLFEPAIRLAEEGFAVSPRLHGLLALEGRFADPAAQALFFDADGRPWPVGYTLRNPALAQPAPRCRRGPARPAPGRTRRARAGRGAR